MSDRDTLLEGLTPLEAQAFYQNGSLHPEQAIQLAMAWMKAGETHVDVAVLATSEAVHWDDLKRDFRTALQAFGIAEFSDRTAALLRLQRILSWVEANPSRLKDLGPVLIEHCAGIFPPPDGSGSTSRLHRNFWRLHQASEDYYDLSFRTDRTDEALQALTSTALETIADMMDSIAGELPD